MDSAAARLSVAVDIGGTFTDLVAFDERSGQVLQAKSLTTPHELSQGVWDCLRKAGIAPRDAENFVHGSTVAINIAIEEKGAKTALVVTKRHARRLQDRPPEPTRGVQLLLQAAGAAGAALAHLRGRTSGSSACGEVLDAAGPRRCRRGGRSRAASRRRGGRRLLSPLVRSTRAHEVAIGRVAARGR